ncbi:MAG TPA: ParB N-terminal domain-containing protein [Stenotrophomonas sp.]|nr:ParB N-terminal domain-containing protein [Stenotrophomonas sp.]
MVCSQPIQLLPLPWILPTEQHHGDHAEHLARDMTEHAVWRVPIVVERCSYAVMDGHHRLCAAHRLGLAAAPCLLLDYQQVQVQASREGYLVTPAEILRRALTGDPYPPKTTRHRFDGPLPLCNISLPVLRARGAGWAVRPPLP